MNRRPESALLHQLRSADGGGKCRTAVETLGKLGSRFDPETVETLAAELKDVANGFVEGLPESANSAYLGVLLSAEGTPEAVGAWERFFAHRYNYDPFHRLGYARALAGQQRYSDAARQLQLALSQPVRYSFFPRAEKLVRTVAAHTAGHLREVRVAILSTSTTSLLIPVLEALCLRDRIRAEFYQGLYGAIEQEILDPQSGLAKFRPDVVFLMGHWRDLALPAVADDEDALVERVTGFQKTLWLQLSERFACHVIQHAFDFAAEDSYGPLSRSLRGGRTRITEAINRRMREDALPHVSILDAESLQRTVGIDRWEDAGLWNHFRQHPGTEALPVLAETQQAYLRAVLGLTRKVLVTDLDNTLWKGVIGEDGLHGIGIGPGNAAGEAHRKLQEYLKDLKSRGILLVVCSKNNREDAMLPFEKHEHMVLKAGDFAAFHANWNDKAQNLREIAETLSLGLESFVFLDDSPLEREWVRSQLPQVAVVELSSSVWAWVRDLDRRHYFFAVSLSQEDLARADQYGKESQREILRASAQSLDEFLAQLQLEASVARVSDANLARVTQLANKTNQFNLTTRRYTEAQLRLLASDGRGWTGAFQLSDRMGAYGLIGLILCIPGGTAGSWEIETWLMSCRALGRQMERFMLDRLLAAAAAASIRELTGIYKVTAKNALVADLYDRLGFAVCQTGEGERRYRMTVSSSPPVTATHIRDLSESA